MFERFTKDARAVVAGAVGHAERTGAEAVDEEHMLLALLDREGSRGSFALVSLRGGRSSGLHGTVARRGTPAGRALRADTEALSGLGIDLSEIVSRGGGGPRGQGAGSGNGGGGGRRSRRRPFAPGAKDVLTRSLRAALARHDRHIGDEHLLMALTARPGVPAEVLADHGVAYEAVTRVLYGGGEAKAG